MNTTTKMCKIVLLIIINFNLSKHSTLDKFMRINSINDFLNEVGIDPYIFIGKSITWYVQNKMDLLNVEKKMYLLWIISSINYYYDYY